MIYAIPSPNEPWLMKTKNEKRVRLIQRSAPPEDCSGVSGYEEFLKAFRNPRHPDHESMLSWAGERFDPERCDLEYINSLLCKVR